MGITFNPLIQSGFDFTGSSGGGGGGANTSLSNLTSPTAINQALTFGSGVAGSLSTFSPAININSQNLSISTGNVTGSGIQGNIQLLSSNFILSLNQNVNVWGGPTPAFLIDSSLNGTDSDVFVLGSTDTSSASIATTYVYLLSGDNLAVGATAPTGGLYIASGNIIDATATANSGNLLMGTGGVAGSGTSGPVSLGSGQTNTGISGDVSLSSGPSTSGATGKVLISTGTTSGTRGRIQLKDGSEGTSGWVWTSTDTLGNGHWVASASGFSNPMTTTGDMIYSNPGSTPVRLPVGTLGQVLSSNGTIPIWSNLPGATAFTLAASTQVTVSSSISGSVGTFQTFSTSPAFLFTPQISGTYKIYASIPLEPGPGNNVNFAGRIFNTSGGATLLQESQVLATGFDSGVTDPGFSGLTQSVYNLIANTTYVFDIQGQVQSSGSLTLNASSSPFYMFCEGVGLQGTLNTTGSSFDIFASSKVNTDSASFVTSVYPTFSTFDNSPAFTFTPAITGKYKVYASVPIFSPLPNQNAQLRIHNTSGGAVLLQESQTSAGAANIVSNNTETSLYQQSVYSLTAGTTYVFDIQGAVSSGGSVKITGSAASFYMFAEGIGLNNNSQQFPVNMKVQGSGSFSASNPIILNNILWDSNSGYNPSTGQYKVPYSGYYLVGFSGQTSSGTQTVHVLVNGVNPNSNLMYFDAGLGVGEINAVSTSLKLNAGDIITWISDTSATYDAITYQWVSSSALSQGLTGPQGSSSGSAFAYFASTAITTLSSLNPSTSFVTFSNSPAFTFTPTISGIYKVYSPVPLNNQGTNSIANTRIFNTSGGATLLQESQAALYAGTPPVVSNEFTQSVYSLNAGTTYVFDIQGKVNTGSGVYLDATDAGPFYIFAEGISLSPVLASPIGVVTTKFGVDPSTAGTLPTTNGSPIIFPFIYYDTTGSYNNSTGQYIAPVTGYYDVSLSGMSSPANYDIELWVNGINVSGSLVHQSGGAAVGSPCQVYLNYGDALTVIIDNSSGLSYSVITGTSGITPQVSVSLRPPTPAVFSRMVKSNSTGTAFSIPYNGTYNPVLDTLSAPLSVTVACQGGDVEIGLQDDGSGNPGTVYGDDRNNAFSNILVRFKRDGVVISAQQMYNQNNIAIHEMSVPSSSFNFTDTPPPGNHTYTVEVQTSGSSVANSQVANTILYARPMA